MAEQFIQNPSVTPGDLQIELSGGYVTAISGHPVGGTGGGGGPSVVYTGVVGEITVDNQQGTIGIADEIKNSINSKASKVELNTTYNILNEAKQDKLTFGYDDTAISSINGSAIAGQNDMSQYALKSDLDVVSGEVDILTDSSAKWNEVSAKFDTSSWNAYSGKFQLSGDYATKSDLDLYYKKTETSSKSEISAAIKDFITSSDVLQYNVTAVAGIEVTTATDAGVKTFGISVTSTPVVTDTRLSGFNGIQAYEDGNTSGLWDVGLTQNILNTINGKLDSSIAEQTYQPKGNYVSSTDITDMATKTWVGTQGYAKESDLQIVSGELENFALKSEIPTKVSDLEDSANYYKTTETSGAAEISTALSNKVDKPDTTQVELNDKYLIYSTLSSEGQPKGWVDMQTKVYSKSESDETFQKKNDMGSYLTTAKYATDSATFVTETELETVSGEITALIPTNYVTSGDYISGNSQYALTSGGWTKVQTGGLSLPVNIGSNNTITGNSLGAIGNNITVGEKSMVLSITGSSAINNSFAFGDDNYASGNSMAAGWHNSAKDYSFSIGHNSSATNYSFIAGDANTANNYAGTVGRGLSIEGGDYGGLVVGRWNNVSSNALFVVGNGSDSTTGRKDAFVVYTDGTIQAGNKTYATGGACFTQGAWTFAEGHMCHAEGVSTSAIGYGIHSEGCWTKFSADSAVPNSIAGSNNCGVFVGGFANATTSHTYGEATAHSGVLAVYGNGYRIDNEHITASDAMVLYRDGSLTAAGKISANGMFAVSTEATLFGQSRIANVGDTTAKGTNWVGVASDGQGFLKSVYGGNVGALNGTSIQINYRPNTAYGEITVKNSNGGTDGDSKIVHVPTASYDSMNTFDPVNGPNYMLRKTASGFDIGAKVVNVTTMPQNTEANTYYFVYEV